MTEFASPEGEGGTSAALRDAATRLAASSDTPRLDAELLLAHSLGIERDALLLDPARFAVPDGFAALVARRLAHEPVAYILGYRDFWSIRLAVGTGALIPRPDSETLIEAALAQIDDRGAPLLILDLGTGPGTLLLALLSDLPQASGLGIDTSPDALDFARENARRLAMHARAIFREGSWGDDVAGQFDLILCNPPYIATGETLMPDVADHEPAAALFAGSDGLADYRRIVPDLLRLLAPGGLALLEIGVGQRAAVTALAAAAGLAVACRRDLGGRDRALLLTRPG